MPLRVDDVLDNDSELLLFEAVDLFEKDRVSGFEMLEFWVDVDVNNRLSLEIVCERERSESVDDIGYPVKTLVEEACNPNIIMIL